MQSTSVRDCSILYTWLHYIFWKWLLIQLTCLYVFSCVIYLCAFWCLSKTIGILPGSLGLPYISILGGLTFISSASMHGGLPKLTYSIIYSLLSWLPCILPVLTNLLMHSVFIAVYSTFIRILFTQVVYRVFCHY